MKRILPFILVLLLLAGCQAPAHNEITDAVAASTQPSRQPISETEETTVPPQFLSEQEATAIALQHAGLNEGAVKSFSVELDYSEGVYEVEFSTKGIEYDYEIDIYTGEIIKSEKD